MTLGPSQSRRGRGMLFAMKTSTKRTAVGTSGAPGSFLRRRATEKHERLMVWVSLLWSAFFFIDPYYKHALRPWMWFGLFYATFLLLYFATTLLCGKLPRIALVLLFLIGFVYYPFNHSAIGVFVYPAVLMVYLIRGPRMGVAARWFAGIVSIEIALIFAETKLLHLSLGWAETVTFYIVVIGVSNFAYSRQQLVTEQLQRANDEIERLAQTAERERIARDLHDLLGHTLTVIALKADLANRIFERDPAMAQREIAEVEQTAREALAEVREAVSGYRAEGFPAEVARTRRALAAAGVQLTTNLEPIALPESLTNALCLALREGVTNVVRHAGATACSLTLLRTDAGLRLSLEDNGHGSVRAEGNGLRGMRERIREVGGELMLAARPEGGLRLVVELPLPAVQALAPRTEYSRAPGASPTASATRPALEGLMKA